MKKRILRGNIYYADLTPVVGSEQGGVRPVLIIQNNKGNKYSPTTVVAAITSKAVKVDLPIHFVIEEEYVNGKESTILLEQIRTIDKQRLQNYIGTLPQAMMQEVDKALAVSLGLNRRIINVTEV
jgi:Growth inhibitor